MKASPGSLALCAGISLLLFAGCERDKVPDTAPGVSWRLATQRASVLSNIRYELHFVIPEALNERIRGYETLRFELNDASTALVIDIIEPEHNVIAVRVGDTEVEFDVRQDHIVIPAAALKRGENAVAIDFTAGDGSLNRNPDYLYTLFVPDRARFAFPCFDQPNLKARYTLTLDVPAQWEAVANAPLVARDDEGERTVFRFAPTHPISTYLFSFAAGEFDVLSSRRGGRLLRMYHRETDSTRVARNTDAVFELHARALDWLESYTNIEYPFEKFDFVLIPSFQYRGMEHPGAILYRSSSQLLDETATPNDMLRRASLIAHETSHMWFGDLVTMEWFNDVWMKEVFANFMAAKIVNPSFPDLDHDLRFLLAHYPAAYEVDRSEGANPIRQQLENLREAGTLYGAIIYQKAPIVMRQLEEMIGEQKLREGLRQYLSAFAFGNASWPDLIGILDAGTDENLAHWSSVWVEEPGRPTVSYTAELDATNRIVALTVSQSDPAGLARIWNQRLALSLAGSDTTTVWPVHLHDRSAVVEGIAGAPAPDYILANGRGVGYGLFELDDRSLEYLLVKAPSLPDGLSRGIVWLTLWDAMLEGRVAPSRILDLALEALRSEQDAQLVERILAYLRSTYWRFVSAEIRSMRAPRLETLLWELASAASTTGLKSAYFSAFRSIALSDSGVERLYAVWRQEAGIPGLNLAESDYTRLAFELAIREVDGWELVLNEQADRIENPDRRERFAFIRPALAADPAVRDSFFESLKEPANREHEPWVLEALDYLHHPLRAPQSEKYILPSLMLLEEVQATGDIFFPKGWLDSTLTGHNSASAAAIVRGFLTEHPSYPPRLVGKILQSADGLFRSAAILHSAR